MLQEFKDFIERGNVVELGVAFVLGAAFTAIVNSFVDDIIMPLIGAILGGLDFSTLSITIRGSEITYGNFIQSIITFFIVALVLFFVIKAYNRMQQVLEDDLGLGDPEEEGAPAAIPADVVLLTEIRDLLKEQ